VWYGKSYYRPLIGNHTLAFDWYHFWWPWSTFEGHFSLGCHFHVHFSNPWHAFVSHGLPAIAELLVLTHTVETVNSIRDVKYCMPLPAKWCFQFISFHCILELWPFSLKIGSVRLCPKLHQWYKFGENSSKTYQEIVLTMFGMCAQTNKHYFPFKTLYGAKAQKPACKQLEFWQFPKISSNIFKEIQLMLVS